MNALHFYNSPFYEIFTKVRTDIIYPEKHQLVFHLVGKLSTLTVNIQLCELFSFSIVMECGALLFEGNVILKLRHLNRPRL